MTSLQSIEADNAYRVLVVEDNPNDRALYKRLLSKSGLAFKVYEAGSVTDGLEVSQKEDIDCILLDYRLPDADGIDFIKSCRKAGVEPNAAIVMVTGQGSEQTAVEAMKLGALDYIAKNTILEGFFVQSILNAIERSHLRRRVKQYQEELEKSYLMLSDFTHTVSHDLKAPMRRIAQYCDILKEETGSRLGPEATDYVDRLNVSARRMQNLIDDLLIYSRTLNAREEKTPTDFRKIIAEVEDDLKVPIEENHAAVIVGDMPTLPVCRVMIKELFQNLIDNALKYRGEQDPIIEVTSKDLGSHYLFELKNNGKSIDKKYHESIFKAFERLHNQEDVEGTGLGLSICSKVVEKHRGKIWVESEPGEGATFRFTIAKANA